MDIPSVTTDRLALRPFTMQDVDELYAILLQPDILRYFPPQPRPLKPPPREAAERMINAQLKDWEEHGYAWWAVEMKDKPGLLGWCGLGYLPETNETEVAYLLRHDVWGKGLATEATRASLAWGFERFSFGFIVGIVHPENIASRRVLEKCGLKLAEQTVYFGMDCCRYVIQQAEFVRPDSLL